MVRPHKVREHTKRKGSQVKSHVRGHGNPSNQESEFKAVSFKEKIKRRITLARIQRNIIKEQKRKEKQELKEEIKRIKKEEKIQHERDKSKERLASERAKFRKRLREGGLAKRGAKFLGRKALEKIRKKKAPTKRKRKTKKRR